MKPRALCRISHDARCKREVFAAGLASAGFDVVKQISNPEPGDVLLIWNRHRGDANMANAFEAAGATVLVTENGWLGKHWRGLQWFALCEGHHLGAGIWPQGDDSRWDSWQVKMEPWRHDDGKIIFAQRGIGEIGLASPPGWAESIQRKYGGRIRKHPGAGFPVVSLEKDLDGVGEAFT